MKGNTEEQIHEQFQSLRRDPQKYMAEVNALLERNPNDPELYDDRHLCWLRLKQFDRALADISKSVELNECRHSLMARAEILMKLGRFREALADHERAEALEPDVWLWAWGPLDKAHCQQQLGDTAGALASCAKLPDDHWSPGLYGAPKGNKDEVIAEIRRRAAIARGERQA